MSHTGKMDKSLGVITQRITTQWWKGMNYSPHSTWRTADAGCCVKVARLTGLFFSRATWHAGSQFPDQGLNLHPMQWKHRVLTTRLPGKSLKGLYTMQFHLYNSLEKVKPQEWSRDPWFPGDEAWGEVNYKRMRPFWVAELWHIFIWWYLHTHTVVKTHSTIHWKGWILLWVHQALT